MISASPNAASDVLPHAGFILSSKVGKLLRASRDHQAKRYSPFTTSPNAPHLDYTIDGMLRSVDDCLQRLGFDRRDIAFVHDLSPDNTYLPDDCEALWPVTEEGAFLALTRLRERGVADARGMGVNCPQLILRCLEVADGDVHLLSSQYSLLDFANAVEQVFPAAGAKDVSFVVGEPRYDCREDDALISGDRRERLADLRVITGRHGVDLVAAALQFSLAPNVVSALMVGTASPTHILADHAALRAKTPFAFWQEMRSAGILHAGANNPTDKD